ncbi:heavy metal-associated isoprenylated plant protein 2-like [Cynara cardunculus var. scolymus]|uniref:Heavy metal-associated domain, HMA n=1 Tax=Cynara cardunculus var. scolymus TaxID=59895 RepID=A0A118K6Y0_CYNCS|nr:heavy metal-associated isoprenylated plant protein 2-like [Cynara cardunculus var. scolymus]KVI11388.1 Heavy metal-associated domain, HMA [Cynara cardunculus var. scolymus]
MPQEIKLKVRMQCEKCKIEVMKTVTELSGVDEISVDLEKEILVVIGDVDPVSVATRLRKKRRVAEILSVRKYRRKDKVFVNPRVYYNINSCENGYEQVFRYPPSNGSGGNCNIL